MLPLAQRLENLDLDVNVPTLQSPGTVPATPRSPSEMLATQTVLIAKAARRRRVRIIQPHEAMSAAIRLKGIENKDPSGYNRQLSVSAWRPPGRGWSDWCLLLDWNC